MTTIKPAEVWLLKPDGTALNINDWDPYYNPSGLFTTDTIGTHDIPTQENQISVGYARGGVYSGGRWQPRQFSINVHINAGEGTKPHRNAAHNAARDQLIGFLGQRGQPVTIRTQYLGTSGYWDLSATFQDGKYVPDTADYTINFLAPDPVFQSSLINTQVVTLDATHVEVTTPFLIGGNQPTYPVLAIQPTAQKDARWGFARNYTVTNNQNLRVLGYPIAIPFDFAWHIANGGRLQADGRDLRVYVNGLPQDFWMANFPLSSGQIWTRIDLDANVTVPVTVLYNNPAATAYANYTQPFRFDYVNSSNAVWVNDGAFIDVPGKPSGRDQQWNVHQAQSRGFQPILVYEPGPWNQDFTGTPTPVNVAGGYIPNAVSVEGYAGLAFHHPFGITQVAHHGFTMLNPAVEKLALRVLNDDGTLTDVWTAPTTDTSGLLTAYTGTLLTAVFSAPVGAVVFALRSLSVHNGVIGRIGGADHVELTIHLPPTVTGANSGTSNETQIYMLEFTLQNETSGEEVTLTGLVTWNGTAYNSVTIDFDQQIVQMAGSNMMYGFAQVGTIREIWLRLLGGQTNSVRVRDEAVNGLTVTFTWLNRRI